MVVETYTIAIIIAGILGAITGMVVRFKAGKMKAPAYQTNFYFGIVMFLFAIAMSFFQMYVLSPIMGAIGVYYIVVGLMNKKSWGTERKMLDLSVSKNRNQLIIDSLVTMLLIVVIVLAMRA